MVYNNVMKDRFTAFVPILGTSRGLAPYATALTFEALLCLDKIDMFHASIGTQKIVPLKLPILMCFKKKVTFAR